MTSVASVSFLNRAFHNTGNTAVAKAFGTSSAVEMQEGWDDDCKKIINELSRLENAYNEAKNEMDVLYEQMAEKLKLPTDTVDERSVAIQAILLAWGTGFSDEFIKAINEFFFADTSKEFVEISTKDVKWLRDNEGQFRRLLKSENDAYNKLGNYCKEHKAEIERCLESLSDCTSLLYQFRKIETELASTKRLMNELLEGLAKALGFFDEKGGWPAVFKKTVWVTRPGGISGTWHDVTFNEWRDVALKMALKHVRTGFDDTEGLEVSPQNIAELREQYEDFIWRHDRTRAELTRAQDVLMTKHSAEIKRCLEEEKRGSQAVGKTSDALKQQKTIWERPEHKTSQHSTKPAEQGTLSRSMATLATKSQPSRQAPQHQPEQAINPAPQLSSRGYEMRPAPPPAEPGVIYNIIEQYKKLRRYSPPLYDLTTPEGKQKAISALALLYGIGELGAAATAAKTGGEVIVGNFTKAAQAARAVYEEAASFIGIGGIGNITNLYDAKAPVKIGEIEFKPVEHFKDKTLYATDGRIFGHFYAKGAFVPSADKEYGVYVDDKGELYVLNRFTGEFLSLRHEGFTSDNIKTPGAQNNRDIVLKTSDNKTVRVNKRQKIVVVGDLENGVTLDPHLQNPVPSPAPKPVR